MTEEVISQLEGRTIEFTQSEQQRENDKKINDKILRDLWDKQKKYTISSIGIPEREEKSMQ